MPRWVSLFAPFGMTAVLVGCVSPPARVTAPQPPVVALPTTLPDPAELGTEIVATWSAMADGLHLIRKSLPPDRRHLSMRTACLGGGKMIVRSVSPSLKAGSNVACDGHFTIGQDITVDESTDCAAQGPFTIEAEINASVTDWVVVVESFGERCASPTPSR